MWQESEPLMARAVNRHDAIVAGIVRRFSGHLVRTKGEGDSTFSAYESAQQAVLAAVEIQRALGQEEWVTAKPITTRIGIHLGEAESRAGDYYGNAVNLAARLRAMSNPGQIIVSSVIAAEGPGVGEAELLDLGIHRPKDFDPMHIFQVFAPGLRREFPPLGTATEVPNNLPRAMTSFVGRRRALTEISGRVAKEQVLSLVGPGGCGKTRLMIESARQVSDGFQDGVFFVDISGVNEASQIPQTIAEAIGIRTNGDEAVEELIRKHVRSRKILLLFDNCEQTFEACGKVIRELVDGAADLRVMASSQRRLEIPAESVFSVDTLSTPEPEIEALDELLTYEAIQLFVERAKAKRKDFELRLGNASDVAEICRKLDGIPLAIELAASRVRMMEPADIRMRLHDRFKLLRSTDQGIVPRHETLLSAIQWSYDLLDPQERVIFEDLSIFEGGFSLAAAEAVAGDPSDPTYDPYRVVEFLSRLVDRSLVSQVYTVEGDSRYRILESVRMFGRGRLQETNRLEGPQSRFAEFFVGQAMAADEALTSGGSDAKLGWFRVEQDNLRAAISFLTLSPENREQAARLVIAMTGFWRRDGKLSEAREWLDLVSDVSPELAPLIRARLQNARGTIAREQGDLGLAKTLFVESIAAFKALGDGVMEASARSNLGLALGAEGRHEEARSEYEQAMTVAEQLDDHRLKANILNNLGLIAQRQGRIDEAVRSYERYLEVRKESPDSNSRAEVLLNLGWAYETLDSLDRASQLFQEALDVFKRNGFRANEAVAHYNLANLARRQGSYENAKATLALAEDIFETRGNRESLAMCALQRAHILRDEGDAGSAADAYLRALSLGGTDGFLFVVKRSLEELSLLWLAATRWRPMSLAIGALQALGSEAPEPCRGVPETDTVVVQEGARIPLQALAERLRLA